jgi:peroxiredoxin
VFLVILLVVVMLLILQSLAIFQLMQQSGRVLLRLDALEKQIGSSAAKEPPPPGLPIGEAAPDFELPDLEGNSVSLRQLVSGGKPVVMLFINPGCGPCTALLPEAAAWQRDAAARFNLALISQGTADENRVNAKAHGIRTFLQRGQEISSQYAVGGTPGAVLVLPDGVIGSAVASGTEAIRLLVSSVINESVLAEAAGLGGLPLREGATAPPLVFPDLEGRMFNLSQLRGKPAILLFWNPGCGFCQSMYGDLKSWEKKAVAAGTNVVLISTGTIEANRKEKFRSPVLLDQNFKAGAAFGATGTPSALALDDQGRIVSKMAVGKQDILDLVFHAAFRP